jgi:hypothetical protein
MAVSTRLKLSAVLFAVLWTAGMWFWDGPRDVAGTVILALTGTLAGFLWYWIWKKIYPLIFRQNG